MTRGTALVPAGADRTVRTALQWTAMLVLLLLGVLRHVLEFRLLVGVRGQRENGQGECEALHGVDTFGAASRLRASMTCCARETTRNEMTKAGGEPS